VRGANLSIHPGSDFMTMNLQAASKTASVSTPTISSVATSIFSQFSFASATPSTTRPAALKELAWLWPFDARDARCLGRATNVGVRAPTPKVTLLNCACRRHQDCHCGERRLRNVADFWAALGQAAACLYLSMWGVGRKEQWRGEK
jgi:hypothetical protein